MYKRKHGFTLIELMMVMGIIALIISMGVPIYSAMAMSRSLGGSAELINGAFLKYRSKATASGQPIFAVFEHWHMDPSLAENDDDWDKLTPPKIQAYMVDANDEVENGWEVLEIDDPIVLPKGTWFHNAWVEDVNTYSSMTSDVTRYAAQGNAVADYYGMGGNVASDWANRLFMVIFQPDGHLQIIGRENVPGYEIEYEDSPNADIWMTNGDDTILIDINPSTGRLRSVRLTNSDYESLEVNY